jgi:solute carrier family 9B (sodium/hydrogen exchanger), member 1/2
VQAPLELLGGFTAGTSLAWLCCKHTFPQLRISRHPVALLLLVTLIPVCLVLGSGQLHCQGAGALAAFIFGFTVRNAAPASAQQQCTAQLLSSLQLLWTELLRTLLFTLIGAEVDLHKLNSSALGWGALMLALALLLRVALTFATMLEKPHFTRYERLFVAAAWTKATVQAVTASMPLDALIAAGAGAAAIERAHQLLTISIMAIFVTAPLGSVLITVLGPRCLSKAECDGAQQPEQMEAATTSSTTTSAAASSNGNHKE